MTEQQIHKHIKHSETLLREHIQHAEQKFEKFVANAQTGNSQHTAGTTQTNTNFADQIRQHIVESEKLLHNHIRHSGQHLDAVIKSYK